MKNRHLRVMKTIGLLAAVLLLAGPMLTGCYDGADVPYGQDLTGDLNWYFGNLHSHTNVSDGYGYNVRDALTWARDNCGMDFYAVTDHIALITSSEWNMTKSTTDSFTENGKFVAISGFEWTAAQHVNGFMVDSISGAAACAGWRIFYDWIDGHEGLAHLNHPGSQIIPGANMGYNDQLSDNIFAVETANGSVGNRENRHVPYYILALDNGYKVGPTGNLDNHKLKDAGRRTVILAKELNEIALYDAMMARRFYSTDDPNTRITYRLRGHWMGQTVDVPGAKATFEVRVSDDEPVVELSIITNGGKIAASKMCSGNDVTWNPVISVKKGNYYFLKVTGTNLLDANDSSSTQVAVTAPIWIRKK